METIVMHLNRAPEPPSRRSPLPIPGELEELVLACLAKNPEQRPQSADQLAMRLASLPMAEAWTPLRAREWWDEHRPASSADLQPALAGTG
jgi:serine/threonine-protein kinase